MKTTKIKILKCLSECETLNLQLTLSEAYTASYRPSVVTEMPTAGPLINPIKGFGKSIKAPTNLLKTNKKCIVIDVSVANV